MAKETGKGGPLRDWESNSYSEDGRAASGLSEKGYPKHECSLPKSTDYDSMANSADPGRRNK